MSLAFNAPLAQVEVGGRVYPYRTNRQCKVCAHPQRLELERTLAEGRGYKGVFEIVPDTGLSVDNLREHMKAGHMPFDHPAVKKVAETTARDRGAVVATAGRTVAKHLAFCENILDRVNERIEEGDLEPTIKEALMAARILAEAPDDGPDLDDLNRAFVAIMETTEAVAGRAAMDEIGRQLLAHPVLTELRAANGI